MADRRGGYRGSVGRGDSNPAAKISNDAVARARREYLEGHSTAEELAKRYGVGPSAMKRLLKGEAFEDAGGPTFIRLVTFQEWKWGNRPKEFVRAAALREGRDV